MTIVSRRGVKPAKKPEFDTVVSHEIYIYHGIDAPKKLSEADEEAIRKVFDEIRKQLTDIVSCRTL